MKVKAKVDKTKIKKHFEKKDDELNNGLLGERPGRGKVVMRKMIAAGLLAGAGLMLAPMALADPAPPIAPGAYTFINGTYQAPATVALDCGASCFSVASEGTRMEFRFAGDRWSTPNGITTADGLHMFNQQGTPAELAPA
ncbi:hypothetical protein [Mycolicibacterium septicum]|uniref:hypothetical protein n=1 Tax=Mycolicibacterium septicum TaxID=98668 RepID=UPI002360E665|nr:hypothetical protein [Mycolicibacterium septicum]